MHIDVRLRPAMPAEHVDQFRPQLLEVGEPSVTTDTSDTTLRLADEEVGDAGGGKDGLLEGRAGHDGTVVRTRKLR